MVGDSSVWGTVSGGGQVMVMNELQCVQSDLELLNGRQNALHSCRSACRFSHLW